MTKQRVFIDGNSVGHAAFQSPILKSGDLETQAVFGVLRTLRAILVRYPGTMPVVLWDGASWRKQVAEEYKANRSDKPEKVLARVRYKAQVPYIRRALEHLGVPQIIARNLEADDLAAILTEKTVAIGETVVLITGDEDWVQLVGPNVCWEDHRVENKTVDHWSFKEFTGVDTPMQFVQLKALQGDDSDNLKGVGGIGEDRAHYLINVWGSVENFLADADPRSTFKAAVEGGRISHREPIGKDGKAKKPLSSTIPKSMLDFHQSEEAQAKFNRNVDLMFLSKDKFPAAKQLVVNKGKLDPVAFKQVCMELGFASLVRDGNYQAYLLPFQRHQ